jgi:hypothetical protein
MSASLFFVFSKATSAADFCLSTFFGGSGCLLDFCGGSDCLFAFCGGLDGFKIKSSKDDSDLADARFADVRDESTRLSEL